MQTENKGRRDLFELLAKWSNLLPGNGVQSVSALDSLHQVGKEIQQLCAQVEENKETITEIKPEPLPEQDFKPSFVFQLKTDELLNPQQASFECVFDFCEKLQDYCRSSTKLEIEKDWLKLLLACSSNNYERFMWIHLTFQSANNLKLDWPQVKKRLMCKFDHPTRPATLLNSIASFKYLSDIETIDLANGRFSRLAEEVQIDVTDAYLLGLPAPIRDVISSTMDYDATTSFHCDLKDVQQRAVVFVTAKDGDFVFYSKTAHVALHLEHEKVNKKDCEFHLLAEHSTSNCPDFVIVKYPYMSFTCLTGVPKIHSPTAMAKFIQSSSSANGLTTTPVAAADTPAATTVNLESFPQPMIHAVKPYSPQSRTQATSQSLPQTTSQPLIQTTNQSLTQTANPLFTYPPVRSNQIKQEPPVEDLATRLITDAIAAAKPDMVRDEDIQHLTTLEIVELAKNLQLSGQPYPEALKARVLQLKEEMLNPKYSPAPPRQSRRSESPYRGGSSQRRSASPRRPYWDRSSSRSPSSENGCYVHGKYAQHLTKDCKQAQLLISASSLSSARRSVSPHRRKPNINRKELQSGEENICIFCKLPFKPGHLGYCTEVRGNKKKVPRRRP